MSNCVAIRLDHREGYEEMIPEWITKIDALSALVVKHNPKKGENKHYHMCIICNLKVNAVRNSLSRYFTKGKGNGHHSVKIWDGNEKALSYLFHDEEYVIIENLGYTNDDIERFKQSCDDIKDDLKVNGTSNTLCKAIEKLRQRYPKKYKYDKPEICHAIWDVQKELGNWFPNKFQLERWIMKIQGDVSENEHDWENVKKQWYNDMFR